MSVDGESYESRLDAYKSAIKDLLNHDKLLCYDYSRGILNEKTLDKFCNAAINQDGDADFSIVPLIRLLHLINQNPHNINDSDKVIMIRNKIVASLVRFPFWPNPGKCSGFPTDMVFWSENHIFMLLSSHYLLRQHIRSEGSDLGPHAAFFDQLLIEYLDAHTRLVDASPSKRNIRSTSPRNEKPSKKINEVNETLEQPVNQNESIAGVYEVLSHVYLNYTLQSLLNLVDFSNDATVRLQAEAIVDAIVAQILLVTTDHSVANLSVSMRSMKGTRSRTTGLTINQLIYLLTGACPDGISPSAITDSLITTTWRPKFIHSETYHFTGFTRQCMNHDLEYTRALYATVSPFSEVTPFFWSAGLVTHPNFVEDTQSYQAHKGLGDNCHLWPLRMLPQPVVKNLLHNYKHFSAGQSYTGVVLNVYKREGGLCLSSFQSQRASDDDCCSFQQLTWVANISGVGVWSQSGSGSESVFNFSMTNTHRPACNQQGKTLLLIYAAPSCLTSAFQLPAQFFSSKVRMFWPTQGFDEHMSCAHERSCLRLDSYSVSRRSTGSTWDQLLSAVHSHDRWGVQPAWLWRVARRKACYVGVVCSGETVEETFETDDALIEVTPGQPRICATRLVCHSKVHAWVVRVGIVTQYATLADFARACTHLDITYADHPTMRTTLIRVKDSANSNGNGNALSEGRSQDAPIVSGTTELKRSWPE